MFFFKFVNLGFFEYLIKIFFKLLTFPFCFFVISLWFFYLCLLNKKKKIFMRYFWVCMYAFVVLLIRFLKNKLGKKSDSNNQSSKLQKILWFIRKFPKISPNEHLWFIFFFQMVNLSSSLNIADKNIYSFMIIFVNFLTDSNTSNDNNKITLFSLVL